MREISVDEIKKVVSDGVIESNICLPKSLSDKINYYAQVETGENAKRVFGDMKKNLSAADRLQIPICQDTGMAVIFAEIGQEVHIVGGDFETAVNDGVADGYTRGYLRKSVVADPFRRKNTGDNTPAVIFTRLIPGDKISLTVAPKGFGSENMSRLKMFNPTDPPEKIVEYITECVIQADAKPCPPVVLGVGIGGDFEYCAYLAKKALCRDVSKPNPDPYYADLEKKILDSVNRTGIGPQGFSGDCTALACSIEVFPTHIAGLPVAVNIGCHVMRHKTFVI